MLRVASALYKTGLASSPSLVQSSPLVRKLCTTADVECTVIGAGVVGLAVARALAQRGTEVLVLEAANAIGTETSSRNSEVIHAGIYYPQGSLKARLCVQGRNQLYEFCETRGIPHKRLGKLIVATNPAQLPALCKLQAAASGNGVDLEWLDGHEAIALEPALRCVAALLSEYTGVVDSHSYMLALQGGAEEHGAVMAFKSKVVGGDMTSGVKLLDVQDTSTGELTSIGTSMVVNSAGLHAQHVAAMLRGLDPSHIPRRYLARGCYFSMTGRAPFSRLIYPLPEDGGLGVHLTLDLSGQSARFGPDVDWVDDISYDVDPRRAEVFYPAIRAYYPELEDGSLQADYAGIRPKISGPGQSAADFCVQGEAQHGIKGLVNLFGIESPGLTASIPLGEAVADLLLSSGSGMPQQLPQ